MRRRTRKRRRYGSVASTTGRRGGREAARHAEHVRHGLPVNDEARPYPKSAQLARGDRRYHRKVASPARWQRIIAAKRGPCRVCGGAPWAVEFHHLVARVHGGSDTEANIVPLCRDCHGLVTRRDSGAARKLLTSLTDAEYSYLVHVGGEDAPERFYGIRYAP